MDYKGKVGEEGYIEVCINGNKIGIVFVLPSKTPGKLDIIFFDSKTRKAVSLRSVTELINLLCKKNVQLEEIKNIVERVGYLLRKLELELRVGG